MGWVGLGQKNVVCIFSNPVKNVPSEATIVCCRKRYAAAVINVEIRTFLTKQVMRLVQVFLCVYVYEEKKKKKELGFASCTSSTCVRHLKMFKMLALTVTVHSQSRGLVYSARSDGSSCSREDTP